MEVTRVPPGRPSRTTSGTRTTGWEPLIKANVLAPSSVTFLLLPRIYLRVHTCFCVLLITAMYAYTSRVAYGSEDVIHNKPQVFFVEKKRQTKTHQYMLFPKRTESGLKILQFRALKCWI